MNIDEKRNKTESVVARGEVDGGRGKTGEGN